MKNSMPLRRHADDDYVDQIRIHAKTGESLDAHMVPRFKTSDLSGDEWRVSAILVVQNSDGDETTRAFHRMKDLECHAAYHALANMPSCFDGGVSHLTAFRKGRVLFSEQRPSFMDAVIGLSWHVITANEGRDGVEWNHLTDEQERGFCQQVGCRARPVVFYRLKKLRAAPGSGVMIDPEYDFTPRFVWYCGDHCTRGDSCLEDNDSNFEIVTGGAIQ